MFDGTLEVSNLSSPEPTFNQASEVSRMFDRVLRETGTKNSLEYDESEGVSDTSFASESCCSAKSRRAKAHAHGESVHLPVCPILHLLRTILQPTGISRRKSSRTSIHADNDAVVRTGSTKYDRTPDATPRLSPRPSARPKGSRSGLSKLQREKSQADRDIARLEEICAKLRIKVTMLEKAQADHEDNIRTIRRARDRDVHQIHQLRDKLSEKELLLLKQDEENARLKLKHEMFSVHVEACPETSSQSVDVSAPCSACIVNSEAIKDMESKIIRYSKSAQEAERLGDQVSRLTEERDRYRQELRKLRSSLDPKKVAAILKSAPDEKDSHRIRHLESALERSDAQWSRRVESLRVKHEQLVREYEDTIKQLTSPESRIAVNTLMSPKVLSSPRESRENFDDLRRENAVLKIRVKELQERVESVKQYYIIKSQRGSTPKQSGRCVQRFVDSYYSTYQVGDEAEASAPPAPDYDVSLNDWIELLRTCIIARERQDIAQELIASDYGKTSLVDRKTFARAIGLSVDQKTVHALIDIYAYGDEQVDYKTFLSDVATRCGVYSSDIEEENRILRCHVEQLMQELSERIESVEPGPLLETLDLAKREIAEKENELKMYKSEMNRFLATTRQLRRLGPQE